MINLSKTLSYADDLNADPAKRKALAATIQSGNDFLVQQSVNYGGLKQLSFTPTPFILNAENYSFIKNLATTLHEIVELALDDYYNEESFINTFFSEFSHFKHLIKKTSRYWQGFSRYDFLITPNGQIKFIELNTCCPAGIVYSDVLNEFYSQVYNSIYPYKLTFSLNQAEVFAKNILAIPSSPVSSIAILHDENELTIELEELKKMFESFGVKAVVGNARACKYSDGKLSLNGEVVSATFNKFRICGSAQYFWRPGYAERYESFLTAIQASKITPINNFAAMLISESKKILYFIKQENFKKNLNTLQKNFIEQHIPTSYFIEKSLLQEYVQNKDGLVLKPNNDGRGHGIYIGKMLTPAEWRFLLEEKMYQAYHLQDYIEPFTQNVFTLTGVGNIALQPMYHTGSIFLVNGLPTTIISRVSSEPITNVGKNGFLQPVAFIG